MRNIKKSSTFVVKDHPNAGTNLRCDCKWRGRLSETTSVMETTKTGLAVREYFYCPKPGCGLLLCMWSFARARINDKKKAKLKAKSIAKADRMYLLLKEIRAKPVSSDRS